MNIKWRLKINLQEFLETFCHKDKVKVWNVSSKPGNCRSRTRGLEALLTVSGWFNILSEMNTRSSEARGGLGRPLGFYFKRKHESHLEKQNPAVTVKLFVWLWDDDPTRDAWTMLTYHKNTKLSSASLFHVCTAAWRHVSSRWCLQIVPPKYVMDDTVVGWSARSDKLCVALLWLANVLTAKSLILLAVFCHSGERMFETKSSVFVCSSFVHADIRSVNLK